MSSFVGVNPEMPLETAYENAVVLIPELREQMLAKDRETAEADSKRKSQDAAKAAEREKSAKIKRAKKAAKSVTTQSAPVGKPASTESSLRDELNAQFEQASSA